MISFEKLGNYGRLGNQLFQYAFLRTSAERLGTNFYCPKWDGDDIFVLQDEGVRATAPFGISTTFDPGPQAGFVPEALTLTDGVEIQGFFQSEKYYPDKTRVKHWYQFQDEIKRTVEMHYTAEVLQEAVSISLRIDQDYADTREYFPLYPLSYYEASLRAISPKGAVLVLADRPDLAKQFFCTLKGYDLRFVTELNGPQQLYLMTQCRANIIINSTFAWWGAWLNNRKDHVVVTPSHWCRPGVPNSIEGILCDNWIKVRGTVPIWDHFQMWRLRHPVATIKRAWARKREEK